MSKSTNNVVLLKDVIAAGISAAAVRLVFLENHYRQQLNLTWESLAAAEQTIRRWNDQLDSTIKTDADLKSEISAHLLNNLDTASAVLALRAKEKHLAKSPELRASAVATAANLLGLNLLAEPIEITAEITDLIAARNNARAEKNWNQSDQIRDQIAELGFEVNDTSTGIQLRRAIVTPNV